jgi:hypothetical protein
MMLATVLNQCRVCWLVQIHMKISIVRNWTSFRRAHKLCQRSSGTWYLSCSL